MLTSSHLSRRHESTHSCEDMYTNVRSSSIYLYGSPKVEKAQKSVDKQIVDQTYNGILLRKRNPIDNLIY